MSIKETAKEYKDYVIELRREFHMYPEKSLEEVRTQKRVMEELAKMEIPFESVADTGVVATIVGGKAGKTIALRADMDALDLQEIADVSYRSKNDGFMHGCGHDGHTASLLGAAKVIKQIQSDLQGTVKLFFQPAEEVARGAKKMIAEGVLDGVDAVFGIHVWNDLECGKVSVEAGPRMASAGIFTINVKGKGGHGAMPHQTIDALVVGSSIVLDLQAIVSREINPSDPAVITVGKFESGSRNNVIAEDAEIIGTTRCYNHEVNNQFEDRIRRVCEHTAFAHGATATLKYETLVIPVINDKKISKIAAGAVEKIRSKEAIENFPALNVGEDFSFFMDQVPGVLALVGCKKESEEHYPHHHPKFDIDEDSLEVATALYAQVAYDFLAEGGEA